MTDTATVRAKTGHDEVPGLRRYHGRELGFGPADVSADARAVLKGLRTAGYESYIVGGSLRDLLLSKTPKDFDVATAARPEQVRRVFRRCRLIGRRFRLAHVYSGRTLIEVATFRGNSGNNGGGNSQDGARRFLERGGRIIYDNAYGDLENDVLRRDFTVNSIYYDPHSDAVVCHEDAIADVRARRLRMIGNASDRYREDPVRMLRAVRFLAKLGLNVEQETSRQIHRQRALLREVPPARLFDEFIKLFHSGTALQVYQLLRKYRLFEVLFPLTAQALEEDERGDAFNDFLEHLFRNTDTRIAQGLPVTPAFILAGLWWLPVQRIGGDLHARKKAGGDTLEKTVREVWARQRESISVPARLLAVAREILLLLPGFTSLRPKTVRGLPVHPRFRAGYDLFCLLAQANLADPEICDWWTRLQQADTAARTKMIEQRVGRRTSNHRRNRRRHGTAAARSS